MANKTIIYVNMPPIVKVNGENIKAMLEVDSYETVKKRLDEWNIDYSSGYVATEDILGYIKSPKRTFKEYEAKSELSGRL